MKIHHVHVHELLFAIWGAIFNIRNAFQFAVTDFPWNLVDFSFLDVYLNLSFNIVKYLYRYCHRVDGVFCYESRLGRNSSRPNIYLRGALLWVLRRPYNELSGLSYLPWRWWYKMELPLSKSNYLQPGTTIIMYLNLTILLNYNNTHFPWCSFY